MNAMRRHFLSLGALLLTWLPLAWRAEAAEEQLTVVASFSILGDLVQEVGGDAIGLHVLVGPNSDGHVYQPTPSDSRLLRTADLVVVNGLGFEGWMERLIAAAEYQGDLLVASDGVVPLMAGGGSTPQPDPHAWQDIANVKRYVTNIAEALARLSPDRAAMFRARAQHYHATLDELDADIRTRIASLPPDARTIVTSHDAFTYFGRAYGLQFVAPVGINSDSQPSAADLARLITQIREQRISAVFLENITDPRLLEQITRQTESQVGGTLYSDALSEPDGPAPTYVALWRHNIRVLSSALRATPSPHPHR